ncbi:MAG: putative sensor protein [Bacteroidota bacterium]|jgi:CheY-like chemotaxis protein|nr:putative sensor protein [Bacteroidota bacterium]
MKNILVVEDDYILALAQVRSLQKKGYNIVASVPNGIAAIEAVKNHNPDLIVMDIRIDGDMDGIDTMLEIQKFSDVPVIYSTGNSEAAIMERAKLTNMKGFLIKPIDYNQLHKMIES